MGLSMIVSVILVYLLMVALYNSYVSPFIIIFSVPVAAVGAIGALLLTHRTLNLFSLIGTILLIGIATKNGILLVDYANTLRERGLDKLAAIKESAHTRFRPIIMTSFSVVAGNIPLALALESRRVVALEPRHRRHRRRLELARSHAAAHSQRLHVGRAQGSSRPQRSRASLRRGAQTPAAATATRPRVILTLCHPERSEAKSKDEETRVILSEAKRSRRTERLLSS